MRCVASPRFVAARGDQLLEVLTLDAKGSPKQFFPQNSVLIREIRVIRGWFPHFSA
jgi:hypothetical protein